MPVKIYWGPPGSYKTSAAVEDHVTHLAREGRTLISNVRGLTEEGVRKAVPNCHKDFKLISLRNDIPEELDKLRRWWGWAPFGAFFILDEVQVIYPIDWTARQFAELVTDNDRETPSGSKLPKQLALAFDQHRHGNWDFVFTTPSIKKVIPVIRGACEFAYRHKNLAVVSSLFKGRFLQSSHGADDNGNPSDLYDQRWRKIKPETFALYQSTATGVVTDTKAGTNIFKDPRFLFLGLVLLCALYFVFRNPVPSVLGGDKKPARSISPTKVGANDPGTGHAKGMLNSGATGSDLNLPESTIWRLAGYIHDARGLWYVIMSKGRSRFLTYDKCDTDEARNIVCRVDGQLVAEWTGQPELDQPPTGMASTPVADAPQ